MGTEAKFTHLPGTNGIGIGCTTNRALVRCLPSRLGQKQETEGCTEIHARRRQPLARIEVDEGTDLPQASVDGTHQDPEGLPRVAPHGAEHLAQEGDEAQPPLDVGLLEPLSMTKIPLSQKEEEKEEKKKRAEVYFRKEQSNSDSVLTWALSGQ